MNISAVSYVAIVFSMLCLNAVAAPTARTLLIPGEISGQPTSVKLSDELVTFFDKNGCDLPKALRDKVTKNGEQHLIPEDLRVLLSDELNTSVQKIDGRSVSAVLHSASLKLPNGQAEPLRTTGADSYDTLNPVTLIDSSFDNFAYTMDCSGFLNSALQFAGGIKAGDAQSAAKLALSSQRAMVAVRAAVYSPIALAINPGIKGLLTEQDRTSLLYSLINEVLVKHPKAPEDTEITAWRQVALLWTSNHGMTSFQGRASFGGNGGFGVGIVSASGSMDSGSVVGRNISFAKFDTYVIDHELDKPVSASLKDLYATVESLVNNAPVKMAALPVGTKYQVAFALPKLLCRQTWTMSSAKSKKAIAGHVATEWVNGACKFDVSPTKKFGTEERGFLLQTPAGFRSINFSVPVAI